VISPTQTAPPRGDPDRHDHIDTLKEAGLLLMVERRINKDNEMHPLVRWQFRSALARPWPSGGARMSA
jgi:hypothetical protein